MSHPFPWIYRTPWPELLEKGTWPSLPMWMQRVEVLYKNGESSDQVWFGGKKFKSKIGLEVHNFIAWRPYIEFPYLSDNPEFHPEKLLLQDNPDAGSGVEVVERHMETTQGDMVYVRTIQQNMVSIRYRDGSPSVIDYTFLKRSERDRLYNNRTVGTL